LVTNPEQRVDRVAAGADRAGGGAFEERRLGKVAGLREGQVGVPQSGEGNCPFTSWTSASGPDRGARSDASIAAMRPPSIVTVARSTISGCG